ncbi:hypothetical protein ASG47_07005 [Devosia sp. Leaf420]|uniref:hypothetical protein n=1 Tax=Devosia sp. Leaf420 TaxID=1736374 RepID=UPI0007135D91|nr:hypothetical protein [Devosia sp. Leaf420]KQT48117.1 hypothetical protein ASG47_07005 [Devosia sp. Leaf420]
MLRRNQAIQVLKKSPHLTPVGAFGLARKAVGFRFPSRDLTNLLRSNTEPDAEITLTASSSSRQGVALPTVTWATVRVLARLPFLQVSLALIAVMSALIIVAGDMNGRVDQVVRQCLNSLARMDVTGRSLDVCALLDTSVMNAAVLELKNLILSFSAIFIGALLQSLSCPEEVIEFSRAYWSRHLRRPSVIYNALATMRRLMMIFSLIAYAIGFGAVGVRVIMAVLAAWRA